VARLYGYDLKPQSFVPDTEIENSKLLLFANTKNWFLVFGGGYWNWALIGRNRTYFLFAKVPKL